MDLHNDTNHIITQFKPVDGQWELTEENIRRVDATNGRTILHNYCYHINTTPVEVFKYLLEIKSCGINSYDIFDYTPLYWALLEFQPDKGGEANTLTYLLHHTAVEVKAGSRSGFTLLHKACNNINSLPLSVFKYLIEIKGISVNAQDHASNTPLDHAFLSFLPNTGDINILIYLLRQKDVNVNAKDKYGRTLLHQASYNINTLPIDIFKYLIEIKGGDLNIRDKDNETPFDIALRRFVIFNNVTTLTYLFGIVENPPGSTTLHRACSNINSLPVDIFRNLIQNKGCNLNTLDTDCNTPLHNAIRDFKSTSDITILEYLLSQKNINFNIQGQNGHTLLHQAFVSQNIEDGDARLLWSVLNPETENPSPHLADWSNIIELVIEQFIRQVIEESSV